MTWGDDVVVRDRFAAAGISDVAFERSTWVFRHAGPPSELLAIFRDFYGPTMNAFEAAARDHRAEALQRELLDLFNARNHGGDDTAIPATFLKVTATKR